MLKEITLYHNIEMAKNNSGKKIEKKLKNEMLEDISINTKQPMVEISNLINKNDFRKIKNKFGLKEITLYHNIEMVKNNSGKKIEKKLKNEMLEDISINTKQPMAKNNSGKKIEK